MGYVWMACYQSNYVRKTLRQRQLLAVALLALACSARSALGESGPTFYPAPFGVRGTLIYVLQHSGEGNRKQECSLHHFGASRVGQELEKRPVDATFSLPDGAGTLYQPQMSPDGRRILFWVSLGGDDADSLGLLNLETQTFQMVPDSHYCIWSAWSPDSESIAYIWGNLNTVGSSTLTDNIYLQVWKWKTGKESLINANTALEDGSAAWSPHGTLLFSVIPVGTGEKHKLDSHTSRAAVPTLYAATNAGSPKLLVPNAWMPVPSPDGRWVVFFGWKKRPDATDRAFRLWDAANNNLYVSRTDGTQRRQLNLQFDIDPFPEWRPHSQHLMWLPDSKHLLAFELRKATPNQAVIRKWDIAAAKSTVIATLQASQPPQVGSTDNYFERWPWQCPSQDGKYLFVLLREFGTTPEQMTSTVEVVNLANGEMSKLAIFPGWAVIDWHES